MTSDVTHRVATPRSYLMCPPEYFDVSYAINPWMRPDAPVDPGSRCGSGPTLRATYESLGHSVSMIEPVAGLPDMVFAANGATVIDGTVLGVRFRHQERAGEAAAYLSWFRSHGYSPVHEPVFVNEGEGDILVAGDTVLAGYGFRSDDGGGRASSASVFGRRVVSLRLVDPRFYHLDTALCVLDASTAMYYPAAFDDAGRAFACLGVRRAHRGQGRGRGGARAERGLRRAARGARRARRRELARSLAARGFTPCRWTCRSCSRPAAARSAARWNFGTERVCQTLYVRSVT